MFIYFCLRRSFFQLVGDLSELQEKVSNTVYTKLASFKEPQIIIANISFLLTTRVLWVIYGTVLCSLPRCTMIQRRSQRTQNHRLSWYRRYCTTGGCQGTFILRERGLNIRSALYTRHFTHTSMSSFVGASSFQQDHDKNLIVLVISAPTNEKGLKRMLMY